MIVSDSSPLIHLARANAIDLLKRMFGNVEVPPAVYLEVVERGKQLKFADAFDVEVAMKEGWLRVAKLNKDGMRMAKELGRRLSLGRGEIEAIALADQIKALLLIDERPAKRIAASLGTKSVGSLSIILNAVRMNLLDKGEAREKVRKLVEGNFYLQPSLLMDILERLK